MKFINKLKIIIFLFCLLSLSAEVNAQNIWSKIDTNTFKLNAKNLNTILSSVNEDKTASILFPNEKGDLENFIFSTNQVLPEKLASKYPNIHSYKGVSANNNQLHISLTCSLNRIAIVLINGARVTELKQIENTNHYSLINENRTNSRFNCTTKEVNELSAINSSARITTNNTNNQTLSTGNNTLTTLRTAIIVTGEYSDYFVDRANLNSGSDDEKKSVVLAGIVTSINNINAVFEQDLGIHFELIENNDELIFLDKDTDIFTTDDSDDLIDTGAAYIFNNIGANNFDIGHTLSIGFAGLAGVGVLCSNFKADGVSADLIPEGSAFDFTLFSHELGHQLGAYHTQNSRCQRNRFSESAVEPGSGTTIMGYAGICENNGGPFNSDIQNFSDEYFHLISIIEIKEHLNDVSCNLQITDIENENPIIEPLENYTIPAGASFVLDANVTDSDNDSLTYSWEQLDHEFATAPPESTSVEGPLFRSLIPSNNSFRNFPEDLRTNTTWEVIPTNTRTMTFGLTVRDGNTNGINASGLTVNVVDTGELFEVVKPDNLSNFPANSMQEITWNVAGTTNNSINTESVSIQLSYDNGLTFPVILTNNTPNDGSFSTVIPAIETSNNARIKITAIDNIYLTISNQSFIISEETGDEIRPIINPVNEIVTIEINKLQSSRFSVEIYEITGRLLINKTYTSSPQNIDVSNLSTGIYIIKTTVGSNSRAEKLIIL